MAGAAAVAAAAARAAGAGAAAAGAPGAVGAVGRPRRRRRPGRRQVAAGDPAGGGDSGGAAPRRRGGCRPGRAACRLRLGQGRRRQQRHLRCCLCLPPCRQHMQTSGLPLASHMPAQRRSEASCEGMSALNSHGTGCTKQQLSSAGNVIELMVIEALQAWTCGRCCSRRSGTARCRRLSTRAAPPSRRSARRLVGTPSPLRRRLCPASDPSRYSGFFM